MKTTFEWLVNNWLPITCVTLGVGLILASLITGIAISIVSRRRKKKELPTEKLDRFYHRVVPLGHVLGVIFCVLGIALGICRANTLLNASRDEANKKAREELQQELAALKALANKGQTNSPALPVSVPPTNANMAVVPLVMTNTFTQFVNVTNYVFSTNTVNECVLVTNKITIPYPVIQTSPPAQVSKPLVTNLVPAKVASVSPKKSPARQQPMVPPQISPAAPQLPAVSTVASPGTVVTITMIQNTGTMGNSNASASITSTSATNSFQIPPAPVVLPSTLASPVVNLPTPVQVPPAVPSMASASSGGGRYDLTIQKQLLVKQGVPVIVTLSFSLPYRFDQSRIDSLSGSSGVYLTEAVRKHYQEIAAQDISDAQQLAVVEDLLRSGILDIWGRTLGNIGVMLTSVKVTPPGP